MQLAKRKEGVRAMASSEHERRRRPNHQTETGLIMRSHLPDAQGALYTSHLADLLSGVGDLLLQQHVRTSRRREADARLG
jgi:hypothetical protein